MKDLKASVNDEYLDDIERRIKLYEELDKKFKNKWTDFEEKHYSEITELDSLREERNVKLDEIKRAMRTYSDGRGDREPVEVGEFKLIRKWSRYYSEEKLISKLVDMGLLAGALEEGIVVKTMKIAKYEKVRAFLEKHGCAQEFESCEIGEDAGSAVFGPKPIPTLGAELPKE